MASDQPDHPPLGPDETEKWLAYYAEASKRRRARGWHRRRRFRQSVARRIRPHLIMGTLLALAAVATTVALLLPRS
jgi:hypothetical protein